MSRTTTEQIIAHVDLLRAVDGLLSQAETVREKREALQRLVTNVPVGDGCPDNRTAQAETEGGCARA